MIDSEYGQAVRHNEWARTESPGAQLVNALLDIVTAAMERWQCGPEQAVAALLTLQQDAAVTRAGAR